MQQLYKIIRYKQNGTQPKTQKTGLTLEQARNYVNDPETSSKTAEKACNGSETKINNWHDKQKHWFDGFVKE